MTTAPKVTFIRYWGSYFKSRQLAGVLAAEISAAARRGWKIYLVLEKFPVDPEWMRELLDLRVEIVLLPRARRHFDVRCILRARELVRRVDANIFHCDNIHTSPMIGAALGGAKVRIWMKRAMNPEFENCRRATFKERMAISTRLTCFLATRIIAVSRAVKDELIRMGINERKIVVRTNPRKLRLGCEAASRSTIRANWGIKESNLVVLTVGHAVKVKGWDILIEAFAQAAKSVPNASLVLVGSFAGTVEESFYAKLSALVDHLGLRNKVHFPGHAGDVGPVLRAADIFAMPSRSEGCANALVEAFEAGLPIVATRVGHAAEIIQDGVNGHLVDRCDPVGMGSALERLLREPAVRRQFAASAVVPDSVPSLAQYSEQMALDYEEHLCGRM